MIFELLKSIAQYQGALFEPLRRRRINDAQDLEFAIRLGLVGLMLTICYWI